jgi:hypothetical protein
MPIADIASEDVVSAGTMVALSAFFTVSGTGNPTYLVVSALDRDEYTATATGSTGSFSGNGATLGFSNEGSDARGAGIVFTWNAASGAYVNAIYGSLQTLDYTAPSSPGDVTNISIFTTSSASVAQSEAGSAYALMQGDAAGYVGSATIVANPVVAATPPTAATPDGIAAMAESYVGDAWNMDGCWVLASTIAAEAGAGLPVQSTAIGVAGKPNGEWYVAYNGPVASNAGWESLVRTGDIIVFEPAQGGGHITTCVSGSGSTAEVIDNITYEGGGGQITNPAGDGSADDILISPAHAATQEFAGANPADVVVYALDTPLVGVSQAASGPNGASGLVGSPLALTTLASAADPQGHAITKYQLYDSLAGASFVVGGTAETANSASAAITVSSLSSVTLSYTAAGTDTVDIRAFNGTYWGDWQAVTVTASVPVPLPPKLGTATAAQSWAQGSKVSLTLPSTLFTDPQKQTLTYTASEPGGAPLPAWLSFNPATRSFSGTVPHAGPQSLQIVVTATDTGGLSTSETFTATIPALAPVAVAPLVPTQNWLEGSTVADTLAGSLFSDPQGEALTLKATLASGAALPAWLSFNPATATFSGTAPSTVEIVALKLTATNASGLSASESFSADILSAAPKLVAQTQTQDWAQGSPINDTLSACLFSDPQGEAVTLSATLANGAALPSWLSFNPATDTFSGTAPATAQTISIKVTGTDTSLFSSSEIFSATMVTPTPTVAAPTPAQSWVEGSSISDTLAAGTFADPRGQALTLKATLASGAALPSWLSFNAGSNTFTGTAPTTAQALSVKVTATDTGGLSVSETFSASVVKGQAAGFTATDWGLHEAIFAPSVYRVGEPDAASGGLLASTEHLAALLVTHDHAAIRLTA